MNDELVVFFMVLQGLYFVVSLGLGLLVALKLRQQFFSQSRTRSCSLSISSDSIQDAFALTRGLSLLICCFFAALEAMLMILAFSRVIDCHQMWHFGSTVYLMFKVIRYLLFIFRVEAIYKGSVYAYNSTYLKAAAIGVVVYNAIVFALWVVEAPGLGVHGHRHGDGTPSLCGSSHSIIWVSPLIAEDFVLSLYFLRLFTKPLRALQRKALRRAQQSISSNVVSTGTQMLGTSARISTSNLAQATEMQTIVAPQTISVGRELSDTGDSDELKRVALKCAVVTWMAVLSTALNLSVLGWASFLQLVVLDMAVNNACMVFMTTWFDRHFPLFCALPLSVARAIPCLCGDIPSSF